MDLDKADETPSNGRRRRRSWSPASTSTGQPLLVFPLGPLVDHAWDANVAHPPEVPLAGPPKGARLRRRRPGRHHTSADARRPARRGPGHHHHRRGARSGRRRSRKNRGHGAKAEEIKYLLFRFFDFTVQPNKRYRYRVQLYLENPIMSRNPLAPGSGVGRQESISTTRCSDPSDVVSIPRDDRLLLVGVKPARSTLESSGKTELPREPSGTI